MIREQIPPLRQASSRSEEPGPEADRVPGQVRARLLAVIATVLVIAFLKWSQVVTMPLGFALFLIALAWPLQARLERHLPRWAAFTLTVLALLLAVALFVGALVWSFQALTERAPQYAGKLKAVYGQLESWAREYGLPLPTGGSLGSFAVRLARSVVVAATSFLSLVLLILAVAILGLFEVHAFRVKAQSAFQHSSYGTGLIETLRSIASKYQRYLRAFTLTAMIQGVVVWLFALLVGLDFAVVWGLIAFLLNYLPTVGSTLAVIPPTLFSLVQFDGFSRPLLVFFGMAVLQLLCGNYLDPLIEGRYLALSPVVVLVSIVLWGWIWGIPGAFLGVPITLGIVVTVDHFPNTRWIARLLAAAPKGKPARRRTAGEQEEKP